MKRAEEESEGNSRDPRPPSSFNRRGGGGRERGAREEGPAESGFHVRLADLRSRHRAGK